MKLSAKNRYDILKSIKKFIHNGKIFSDTRTGNIIPGDTMHVWDNEQLLNILSDDRLSEYMFIFGMNSSRHFFAHTLAQCVTLEKFFYMWEHYSSVYDDIRKELSNPIYVTCNYRKKDCKYSEYLLYDELKVIPREALVRVEEESSWTEVRDRYSFCLSMIFVSMIKMLICNMTGSNDRIKAVLISHKPYCEYSINVDGEIIPFENVSGRDIVCNFLGKQYNFVDEFKDDGGRAETIFKWLPDLNILYIIDPKSYKILTEPKIVSMEFETEAKKLTDTVMYNGGINKILSKIVQTAIEVSFEHERLSHSLLEDDNIRIGTYIRLEKATITTLINMTMKNFKRHNSKRLDPTTETAFDIIMSIAETMCKSIYLIR